MPRYLDPKNDLPFKRIFGEHPDLLKSFLNGVMPLKKNQQIEYLEYLPAEQVPENPAKKNSIVDVRCKDNFGRQFIVEMQMVWTPSFASRLLFNTSKAYVQQLDKSENYQRLTPVYGLAILDDVFEHDTSSFYHHYLLLEEDNTKKTIEGIELVLVELPKFSPKTWADRRMGVLWLRFLREIEEHTTKVPAELRKNADIRKALKICEEGAFTEAELAAYEKYWDAVRVERTLIADSKKKGREEGEAKGMAEGEAKGRAEGEAKGREETLIDFVRSCKRNGLTLELTQKLTNLSKKELLKILNALDGNA